MRPSRKRPPEPFGFLERIAYALGGVFFGAAAAAIIYFTDIFHSYHRWGHPYSGPLFNASLITYIKVGAIIGALCGFLFKGKVADVAGDMAGGAIEHEQRHYEANQRWNNADMPAWFIVVVLIIVICGVVYFVRAH